MSTVTREQTFLDACRKAANQLVELGIDLNCLTRPELMMPGATDVGPDVLASGASLFRNVEELSQASEDV